MSGDDDRCENQVRLNLPRKTSAVLNLPHKTSAGYPHGCPSASSLAPSGCQAPPRANRQVRPLRDARAMLCIRFRRDAHAIGPDLGQGCNDGGAALHARSTLRDGPGGITGPAEAGWEGGPPPPPRPRPRTPPTHLRPPRRCRWRRASRPAPRPGLSERLHAQLRAHPPATAAAGAADEVVQAGRAAGPALRGEQVLLREPGRGGERGAKAGGPQSLVVEAGRP
jgi:hypothetical protein